MSFVRLLCAAIVGGLVVFVWGYIAHTMLPTSHAGMRPLPDEDAMIEVMQGSLKERAVYPFPWLSPDHPTPEEMAKWEEAYKLGPRGLIVFDPTGDAAMSPKALGTEFLSSAIAALIAAIIAGSMRATFYGRVIMIACMGVFSWLVIDVSYWNWYRFSDGVTMTGLIDSGVGWLLAGIPIAAITGSRSGCGCGPECGCGPGCGCAKS